MKIDSTDKSAFVDSGKDFTPMSDKETAKIKARIDWADKYFVPFCRLWLYMLALFLILTIAGNVINSIYLTKKIKDPVWMSGKLNEMGYVVTPKWQWEWMNIRLEAGGYIKPEGKKNE